jgi:RNA polymerase sigma-54 factor
MPLAPDLGLEAGLAQRQSPALMAFAHTLALSPAEVDEAVAAEIDANPALERVDSARTGGARTPCLPAPRPFREGLAIDAVAALAPADHAVAEAIVGSLDDRGLLDSSHEEVARVARVPERRVAAVLRALRDVWPPGVGARSARECLLWQIETLEERGEAGGLVRALVTEHLDLLARGAYAEIAGRTGATRAEVVAARDLIRERLRPFPALQLDDAGRDAVRPDVVFAIREGRVTAELVEPRRVRLRIDPLWSALAHGERGVGAQEQAAAQARVERARTFLARLEQRWTTMLAVARRVAERQEAAIRCDDPRCQRPLTRAELAGDLGVHESTVSRAVAGRHALLPSRRLVALSEFFVTSRSVRAVLGDLVAGEQRPLSDAELRERLAQRGFVLARRTVAKHRERLGILPAGLR